jgi:hypothetical protein
MIDFAGTLEPFSSADPQPQGDEVLLRVRAEAAARAVLAPSGGA